MNIILLSRFLNQESKIKYLFHLTHKKYENLIYENKKLTFLKQVY